MTLADLSRLAAELDGVSSAAATVCSTGGTRAPGRSAARRQPRRHPGVVRVPDFLLYSFPETFSVPRRFAKHMMVVADLEHGNADAVEDAVIAPPGSCSLASNGQLDLAETSFRSAPAVAGQRRSSTASSGSHHRWSSCSQSSVGSQSSVPRRGSR
jgi:hypothetical protein